jgi:hypothetical protein
MVSGKSVRVNVPLDLHEQMVQRSTWVAHVVRKALEVWTGQASLEEFGQLVKAARMCVASIRHNDYYV